MEMQFGQENVRCDGEHVRVISALWKQRQEHQKFKVILGDTVKLRPD